MESRTSDVKAVKVVDAAAAASEPAPSAKTDGAAAASAVEDIGVSYLELLRTADALDWVLMTVGSIAAAATGAVQPWCAPARRRGAPPAAHRPAVCRPRHFFGRFRALRRGSRRRTWRRGRRSRASLRRRSHCATAARCLSTSPGTVATCGDL